MQLIPFSFLKFIYVCVYIILYTFLGIYCLILLAMEDYVTFVNGYDMDSFDYLFGKLLFFLKKIKIKKCPKTDSEVHI
jgi:hypothetical protein